MPANASDADLPIMDFGEFRIDFHLRCVYHGPEKAKIGPIAFNALEFLVRNRHRVISKSELLHEVWGGQRTMGTVEQAMSQVRRALQDDAALPRYIETVPGHGYRFIASVRAPVFSGGDAKAQDSSGGEPLIRGTSAELPGVLAGQFLPRSRGRSTPVRVGVIVLCGAAVAVCTLGLLAVGQITSRIFHSELPARVRFTERAVKAIDEDGRTLWTHTFGRTFDLSFPTVRRDELARVIDLMGDGKLEVLIVAPFRLGPNPSDDPVVEVDCFSSQGALLWTYVTQEIYQFGDHNLKGPWTILDVMVSQDAGKRAIWVSAAHSVWGNSIVVQLDPATGRGPVRFVNTGVLTALREMPTSRNTFLLAAGFNNEYETGTLAVIDEGKLFAVSPQTTGTRHKCVSCPTGDPDYYFVFPRSEINLLGKDWLDEIRFNAVRGGDIEVAKHELKRRPGVETVYLLRLEPNAHLMSLRYSSEYDMEHRDLERGREINHSLAECPERLHPRPIRMWTPSAGWKELPVKPAGFAQ